MVETKILSESPTIVYHQVSGRMSEVEAAAGAAKAISMINSLVGKDMRFDFIVDMRAYVFDNLNAHRIWSIELKEQKLLKDNIHRVAIIGDDTPKLKVEKEMMESDTLKFFSELELANKWLKST